MNAFFNLLQSCEFRFRSFNNAVSLYSLMLLLIFVFRSVLLGEGMENPQMTGWIAGNGQTEKKCFLLKGEKVQLGTFSTSVGLIDRSHRAYSFENKGDFLTFTLNLDTGKKRESNSPIVLELEEIHQMSPNAFGYTILVDDQPIYFRSYEELVKSPMRYFVAMDRAKILNLSKIKVTIRSESNSKFQISRVTGYHDFYKLAGEQKILQPLQIYSFCDQNPKNISKIKKTFGTYENFTVGAMIGLPSLIMSPEENSRIIESSLSLFKNEKLPFAIMPAQWWGYTVAHADGLGGYFGDLKYNQIIYNPFSKKYHATTPNQWSNTPWPSMNSLYFNKKAEERAEFVAQEIADRYSLSQLTGDGMPSGALVMEWGSGYWRNGDFSDDVVQAARAQGIKLDPTDGLSFAEKNWMQRNIATYNDGRAKAYRKGFGSNAILVNQGALNYPQDQLSNHIYSHCLQATLYPSFDDRLPGWVGGVSENMWPSNEMYQFTDQRHNEYSIQYGKLSCVNLEMTMLEAGDYCRYLRESYANGMDFLVPFNEPEVKWSVEEEMKSADSLNNLPLSETRDYQRHVFDLDYTRDYQNDLITAPGKGVQYKGIQLISDNADSVVICAENPEVPGEVIYTFEDPDKFKTGLIFSIQAFVDLNGAVSILAGGSPENLNPIGDFEMEKKISWFNRCSSTIFDLSQKAKGEERFFVKVRLNGGEKSAALGAVKAYLPWDQQSGPIGFRNDTYGERRVQNSWIQNSVLAQRLLSQYRLKKGSDDVVFKKAQEGLLGGDLMGAIALLNRSISELLPARFAVKGLGPLGSYPFEVQLKGAEERLVVKLLSYSPQKMEIEFYADQDTTALLKNKEKKGSRYLVHETGFNRYSIEERQDKAAIEELKFEVKKPLYTPFIRGATVEGKVINANPQRLEVEVPGFGIKSFHVRFDSSCVFQRKQHGTELLLEDSLPQKNDKVTMEMNQMGEAIKVHSEFGKVTGVIKHFITPQLQGKSPHNGIVELENGSKYELSFNKDHTLLKMGPLDGFAGSYDVNQVFDAFQVGMKVEIQYVPLSYQGSNYRMISLIAEADKIRLKIKKSETKINFFNE